MTLMLLLLALFYPFASSIRVFESQIRLDDDRENLAYSGAQLIREQRDKVSAFSICTRFNLKILGGQEGFTNLWMISNPRPQLAVSFHI